MKNLIKKEYAYIALIILVSMLSVFLLTKGVFGNSIDWLSQHVTIADSIRSTILDQKTLFPDYVKNLMGGCNFYELSYYGYLRPDILFSLLFPNIKMLYIIETYSVLLLTLSCVCTYLFLRENLIDITYALIGSVFILCSTIFYHSHKQIMFVNMIPFLIGALIALDYFLKTDRINIFILFGCLIVMHSYYYSLSCFVVCLAYFIHKKPEHSQWKKFILGSICIVLLTSILTIPTLMVLIQNSKSVASTNWMDLIIPDFRLKSLLYDSYGLGLTYICWLCIVLGCSDKKSRNLSILLLLVLLLPGIRYVLNGCLYARPKILIPFIPLVLLQTMHVLTHWRNYFYNISFFQWSLMMIPVVLQQEDMICLDVCLSFLCLFILKYFKVILLIFPILTLCMNNPKSSFLDRRIMNQYQMLDDEEIVHTRLSDWNRIAVLHQKQLVNQTFKLSVSRASGYTSSYNSLYNHFLFDTLGLNVSGENRVCMLDESNLFYLQMMSIDTILSNTKEYCIPYGYIPVDTIKNQTIYKNTNVLPIAYVSNQTMDTNIYDQFKFPYSLDTLYQYTIVDGGSKKGNSHFIRENVDVLYKGNRINFSKPIYINMNSSKSISCKLKRKTKNKILAVCMNVENFSTKNGVEITVNGIKNRLSKPNSNYFNGNFCFRYVLSSNQEIDRLNIKFNSGNYVIKDCYFYSLDQEQMQRQIEPVKLRNTDKCMRGLVSVHSDGYLVTSIPYKKGFVLKIDGVETKIQKVNKAFVGAKIKKGEHRVELEFHSPGKKIGFVLSVFGSILFLFLSLQKGNQYER